MKLPSVSLPAFFGLTALMVLSGCSSTNTPSSTATVTAGRVFQTLSLSDGDNYLSDLTPISAGSGYGPYERDMSNGGSSGGDGSTLTLNGTTYAKGLGVHANSSLTYDIGTRCKTFDVSMGIDDEVSSGDVIFQIFGDGDKLYESPVVTATSNIINKTIDVSGRKELRLVVLNNGSSDYDHADWANAKLGGCFTYQGPLVIRKGGNFSGNWQSLDPNYPAVSVQTTDPVTFTNSTFSGASYESSNPYNSSDLLIASRADVTVRNSRFYGEVATKANYTAPEAINANSPKNLVIENNYFLHNNSVRVRGFGGAGGPNQTIKFRYNKAFNVDGRISNGDGTFNTDPEKKKVANLFQLINVRNIADIDVSWNQVINTPYEGYVEDNINFYNSGGTTASVARVNDNYIQGGFAVDAANASTYNGGGILVGDGPDGASNGTPTEVYSNQVVATTHYGVGIFGGSANNVHHNRVLISGYLPDGRVIKTEFCAAQFWLHNGSVPSTGNLHDNWLGITNRTSVSYQTQLIYSTGVPSGSYITNNTDLGTISLQNEKDEYTSWLNKVASNGKVIGP